MAEPRPVGDCGQPYVVKEGRHICDLPGYTDDAEVRECPVCLRRWVFRVFGNPAYTGWRRTNGNFLGGRLVRLVVRHFGGT